jgi:uncharacterized membrane protein
VDILTAVGLALPAGLNAYIPLVGLAIAQRLGVIELGSPWSTMGEWWAILLITCLLVVEILADKFPAVDHINDVIQTFIRPAAGAVVAVAASGQAGDNYPLVMVLLGIVLAGGVHAVKASSRPVVNAATGGVGAPVASTIEDVFAALSTVAALLMPVLVGFFVLIMVWFGWWVWQRRQAAKSAS